MDILIAESSTIIASRLAMLILDSNSAAVINHARTYVKLLELLTIKRAGVVILDSALLSNNAPRSLDEIKQLNNKTILIVLSTQMESCSIQRFAAADFLLDKYHEFEKIPMLIHRFYRQ